MMITIMERRVRSMVGVRWGCAGGGVEGKREERGRGEVVTYNNLGIYLRTLAAQAPHGDVAQ